MSANATKISVAERLSGTTRLRRRAALLADRSRPHRARAGRGTSRRDALVMAQAERMAHLGHWVWDVDENRITWSAELFRIHGLDPGLVRGLFRGLSRARPPAGPTACAADDRASLAGLKAVHVRRAHRAAERRAPLPAFLGQVSSGAERGQSQLFGAYLDMTELMLATEGLRRTEEWLEIALAGAHVAVCDWDLRTKNSRWSAGAAQVFDLGSGRPRGLVRRVPRSRPPRRSRGAGRGDSTLGRHRRGPRFRASRHRLRRERALGGRPRAHDSRRSDTVTRLIGTVTDVTERHRADDERLRLLDELRQAQKMEAIGRLAGGVAHDFNNHLTIIRAAAKILRQQPDRATARARHREHRRGRQRAAALTKQLLAVQPRAALECRRST